MRFLKQSEGAKTDDLGRPVYYWKDDKLREVFENLDFKVLDFYQNESIANSDDEWLSYCQIHRLAQPTLQNQFLSIQRVFLE